MKLVVLSVVMLAAAANAANVGDTCTANSQCAQANAYCKIFSPTCGSGTCACTPGYSLASDGSCDRSVVIGGKCGANDMCHGENSECSGGMCQCSQGYKVGLRGTDCVSTLKTERYNGKCYDSVQCYYNMVCLNNQCTCYTGYKVVGDYECVERAVGDSCSSDDDCTRTPNTGCVSGQCQCLQGYRRVSYMTSAMKRVAACTLASDTQQAEGQSCNNTIGQSGSQLCHEPSVCTACTGNSMICGRLQAVYAKSPVTSASLLVVLATTLILVAATLFL